ncbi:MAG TPA: stage III sporulation protein AG [Paenibacillaceae bacterium]|nr:stage III sporulation protein AG [Paenibacillaceae bacterium]
MAGGKWGDFLKGLFNKNKGEKKGKLMPALLLLGTAGVAIMLLGTFFQPNGNSPITSPATSETSQEVIASRKDTTNAMFKYENEVEKRLEKILANISGVGQVSIMVSIESTEEIVVDKNHTQRHQTTEESDTKGQSRKIVEQSNQDQTVIIKEGGGEQPLVLKTIKPKVAGVLVVAEGATSLKVVAMIREAVQRALGIPSYKIDVQAKKS